MNNENYELTNPQKSIWYTEQFYKGTAINNLGGIVALKQKVNFKILKKAVYECIKNNDAFRLKLFYNENGEIEQTIDEFEEFDIKTINVKTQDDVYALSKQAMNEPFKLINSYLFKIQFYKLPNGFGGLIIVTHHLISDAMSISISTNKFINYYSALLKGETFEDIETSYVNYIEAEEEYLQSEKYFKDKEYWNDVFRTIPELGIIPSIMPETHKACNAKRETFVIPKEKLDLINDYCSKNKISPFNFFMGLYSIYIGRVSNLNDFVLGTPILNRSTFSEKNTVGMFISTVPLRFNIDKKISFLEYEKNIASDCFSMLRHQKYPYQYLLNDVRKINPNQPNLYDILISYQTARTNRNTSDINYEVVWEFNNNVADSMQIHLFDLNDEGVLNVSYDYRINKYSSKDIKSIHNRILYMIDQILNTENILLKNIEIVTPEEKDKILNKFNNTKLEYDEEKTFIEYFEDQVKNTPNNIALIYNSATMTYKELNEKANSLAHFLRDYGIKNNSIVGIITNRSFEMIIAILAVLKSGGAYIPIDPEYPEKRVAYTLKNSNCSILLSQEILKERIQNINFKNKTIFIDLNNNEIYSGKTTNPEKISKPEDLSYVIYTSGSTGNPKGVMLTQKNLSNFYNSMINSVEYLADGKYHSIISITTISFDIFAFETIMSLARGLQLFITSNNEQKKTIEIENLLIKNKIEILQTTPSIMNFHLENSNLNGFKGLKYIMLAGEQLPKDLVNKIHLVSPDCKIYNGYGPSETTIFATVTDVTNAKAITIGKPVHNSQIYILNNNLELLPPGVPGEIYISGDCVGKGYLNNLELTREKYIPNPFIKNTTMYKSGDLGVLLYNNQIQCKGRLDNQIKLRGLRIELDEIEHRINSFDISANIKSAIIIKNTNGKESLNAFFSSAKEINRNDLEKYLLKYLPTYMIPNSYTQLNQLPFTPNGKVDRKALDNYAIADATRNASFIQPRNDTEQILLNSIKKNLKLTEFGIDNNIFDYGADSLNIINILSDLFQYNINLKAYDFYKYPTVRSLFDNALGDSIIYKKLDEYNLDDLNILVKNFSNLTNAKNDSSSKTVFITGVTGFLGIHILADLLDNKKKINKIICSIRKKDNRTIKERLMNQLHFYFGTKYDNYVDKYIICIDSNLNEEMLGINEDTLKILRGTIDCVIHCAANVKHYGNYADFEKTNIIGTQNIIDFCNYVKAPLHYISTMTISGNYLLEQNDNIVFDEYSFYENQSFNDNVYSKSKLIAESIVLRAISNGLTATIYRVGDLTGRYQDGVFQKNIEENSIYLRLKSILEIGFIPNTIKQNTLEFTPVEYASKAITKIIWSDKNENRIFHIYNPNLIKVSQLLKFLSKSKIKITTVELNDFMEKIKQLSSLETEQHKIVGIINDFTNKNDLIYNHVLKTDNTITCMYLKRLKFEWPTLTAEYFKKLIDYMISVGFINRRYKR